MMTPEQIKTVVETAISQEYRFPWWSYALCAILAGLASYLAVYLQEKGKNIATKEDIGKITNEIEQVKHEYSLKLETIKTLMSTRLFIHQVRYQNEYDMLVSLSKKITKFKNTIDSLEICILSNKLDGDTSDDIKQKVAKTFAAMGPLMEEYEAHKPFYPQEIYESLKELHTLIWMNLTLLADKENLIARNTAYEPFIDIVKREYQGLDTKGMSELIEKIYTAIRKRVQYWEELHIA